MTLTIDIPDAVYPTVESAFLSAFNAPGNLTNPQKRAFCKQHVINFIRDVTRGQQAESAAKAARDTAITNTDSATGGIA